MNYTLGDDRVEAATCRGIEAMSNSGFVTLPASVKNVFRYRREVNLRKPKLNVDILYVLHVYCNLEMVRSTESNKYK